MSGNAVLDACRKIRERMAAVAGDLLPGEDGFARTVAECYNRRVDLSAVGWYRAPDCSVDPETGQGDAYYVYCFATHLAEVEVSESTGAVRLVRVIAAHDSGRILNPLMAAGQVEGGVAQGAGYALCEEFRTESGLAETRDLSTYLIPTSLDICDDIRVEFVELDCDHGPYGAKGLGEPAIIPIAPAVAAAVSSATGRRVTRLPVARRPAGAAEMP
jgi:CO/xanthine dehydrogenase Mo-binding subunit